MAAGEKNTPPGPGVDSTGQAVIDPTSNVLQLVAAEARRQDELRKASERRQDDLRAKSDECIQEVATIRDRHSGELREAEAKRIDAIRAVDVAAVQQAAQVSAQQAQTLATQVATSADTLRTQVAASAQAAVVALAAALDPIQKDIADLRRAQYEAQGQKTQVVETRDTTAGQRQNWGLIIAATGLASAFILGLAGIVITLLLR